MLNQLVDTYLKEEHQDKYKLDKDDAIKHYQLMLDENRIISTWIEDELVGYMEVWRINSDQLAHIMSGDLFNVFNEEISEGNVCYIKNYFIREQYRNSLAHRNLEYELYKRNPDFEYLAYERESRGRGMKVITFEKAYHAWLTKRGISNGKL